ncbi:hypothetical protein [Fibrisoma montanum]|uniref:hypothetical protein n=1 Tax=Fibrisoma montanum TaxID=2305895 RepID=UPI0011C23754|nr:hypothetical protein [Fibrisoma montanum]
MPYNPKDVVYPQNRIKRVVRVLHDGTQIAPDSFSIAELELQNGEIVFGLRHNYNYWNEGNPDIGYPTVRPGNPTWFILPDVNALLQVMNIVFLSPSVV